MRTDHLGVVVGRFQSPVLHEGYKALLAHLKKHHKNRLVILGISPTRGNKRNPLDAPAREAMIRQADPDCQIRLIEDQESDSNWSVDLDNIIGEVFPQVGKPSTKVTLYGGRDSFITKYSGQFQTKYIKNDIVMSSTAIRLQVGMTRPNSKWNTKSIEYFQRGVIYASENAFPKVYPTVDMAVTSHVNQDGTGPLQLLMGFKPGETQLRFPGGFVDPTDSTLEMAAKRELAEEAPGIAVEGDMLYVGSTLVADWRYPGPERVMTSLFHGEYTFGSTKAGDDLETLMWVPFSKKTREKIRASHQPLYDLLVAYLISKEML